VTSRFLPTVNRLESNGGRFEIRLARRTADRALGSVERSAPPAEQVLSSPGRQLDADTSRRMGLWFGRDFASIRVHTDTGAEASAESLGAEAYTSGNHIVFGRGRYAPRTAPGATLIAHELAHSVQQSGDAASPTLALGNDAAAAESEADQLAQEFAARSERSIHAVSPTRRISGIQRKLVNSWGHEIVPTPSRAELDGRLTLHFPPLLTSPKEKKDATTIVNAMLTTPRSVAALQSWIDDRTLKVHLALTDEEIESEGEKAHGMSEPPEKSGSQITWVKISTAQLGNFTNAKGQRVPDRYKYLTGEQYLAAVATHESRHQEPENLALNKQLTGLQNEINSSKKPVPQKDPRRAQVKELKHEWDVEPVTQELISLIEFDVLHPDTAGYWRSEGFSDFLGVELYEQTVDVAANRLFPGNDPETLAKRQQVKNTYLKHLKPLPPKGKAPK